jgi:hypothetical protein
LTTSEYIIAATFVRWQTRVAPMRHEIEDIRARALDQHDRQAGEFEAEYWRIEGSDYYATAFLDGRKKIDDLLSTL